jgi:hypothetical protein
MRQRQQARQARLNHVGELIGLLACYVFPSRETIQAPAQIIRILQHVKKQIGYRVHNCHLVKLSRQKY